MSWPGTRAWPRRPLSEHLGKLVAGGLLAEERQGRHRYVRLLDTPVAQLLEDLAAQVGPAPARTRAACGPRRPAAMARGRTCYDHFAGRLGIALTDGFTGAWTAERGWPPRRAGRDSC